VVAQYATDVKELATVPLTAHVK